MNFPQIKWFFFFFKLNIDCTLKKIKLVLWYRRQLTLQKGPHLMMGPAPRSTFHASKSWSYLQPPHIMYDDDDDDDAW